MTKANGTKPLVWLLMEGLLWLGGVGVWFRAGRAMAPCGVLEYLAVGLFTNRCMRHERLRYTFEAGEAQGLGARERVTGRSVLPNFQCDVRLLCCM